MYHEAVRKLAQNVLAYIRQQSLLKAGDRIGIAVSGGTDSVALLRLMLELQPELGIVLSVIHFNHHLRGAESHADEQFVTQLAENHELQLYCEGGNVAAYAKREHLSTETAARRLRYGYLYRLFEEDRLDHIATGHTLDDQAETVLMKVVRGAGTRGLAGIYPQLRVEGSEFSVIRPLLRATRQQLTAYLAEIGQNWREDSSNRDLRPARNRVRHEVLPRLEQSLNPGVRDTLAETAEIARSEEEYWQKEVARVLPKIWEGKQRAIKVAELATLPMAMQRRVVRQAAECLGLRLEFRHVEEIIELASGAAKSVMLPKGWNVSKTKDRLQFELRGEQSIPAFSNYEYLLGVPGVVQVPETQACFEAALVPGRVAAGYNPDHMFDPALLQKQLTVRNWRAGDRFWPARSKASKKIKELLQDRKLPGMERKLWPVVTSGTDVVWVRGFPSPARLRPQDASKEALIIRESAMGSRRKHE